MTENRESEWEAVVGSYAKASLVLKDDVATVSFPVADRRYSYMYAIVQGVREVVTAHRDPGRPPTVTTADARASLALALQAQALADSLRRGPDRPLGLRQL